MMKYMHKDKKAFTLAEVLITLVVIGVIAGLTVPALLQNLQDAQLKTAFKKEYSVIMRHIPLWFRITGAL